MFGHQMSLLPEISGQQKDVKDAAFLFFLVGSFLFTVELLC